MKYILNKLQEKTTNNFRVNEIKLDLDLPENFKLKKYEIKNYFNGYLRKSLINNKIMYMRCKNI